MPFPTSRQVDSAERLAETIDATVSAMLEQIVAWRTRIAVNSATDSGDAQARYQECVAVRAFVESKKASPGLAEAYRRRFSSLPPDFDATAAWAEAAGALAAFALWFQQNWPEKTATGKPAYLQWDTLTGQHTTFTVPLTGGAKGAVLSRLDAVIAAFT